MKYREELYQSRQQKVDYLDGLEKVIERRQREAEAVRNDYIKDVFNCPGRYREDLKAMLGWPLIGHTDISVPAVTSEKLSDEDGYSIYRMSISVLEGLSLTGLLFKMDGDEKKPLVIVQHGGLGTPELISGVYGSTSNYNDMLHRVIKHGVHAFAPQLLLWDSKKYDVTHDRRIVDARLKRVGSSITAVEVYGISRALDYFESTDYVSVFGMVGLSYGGFYTLYTAAVDTRIRSAVSCSFFNSRDAVGWPDWTWQSSAEKFDDAEVACLVYPRTLMLEIGDKDRLFDSKYALSSLERVKKLSEKVGSEWIDLKVFDGVHELYKGDEHIERLIKDIMP